MNFDGYNLDFYDEMLLPDGSPREHCRALHDALRELSPERIGAIQDGVSRSFLHEGIFFMVYGDEVSQERIMPVDCVPRIVPAAEWSLIERGLTQRLNALNKFLHDVYGEARIIADGVIPADLVYECPQFRPEMQGYAGPEGSWATLCGTDIVRTAEGFRVLEDNLRSPSGMSYMVATRNAVKAGFRRLYRASRVREAADCGRLLRATFRELDPQGRADPTIALLTPGVYNAAFYEHVFLAREIGAELVEGRDLLTRGGFLHMRTTQGLRRVDVLYRRIDDMFLDPDVFHPDSALGVPGLMDVCKRGNVTLINTPGSGVADDKSVYPYAPDMIRYYLSEEPILANVETRLCRRQEDLEYTLDNLDKLVVKKVGESGGYGMLVGPHATPEEREDYGKQVRLNPADFISQPVLAFSRAPCLVEGAMEPRHVDLRPFAMQGRETRVVAGAFSRVALRRGSLVVNSSQGGGGKDVWVLEE